MTIEDDIQRTVADRNVEQLNFTAKALDDMDRRRGLLPRARPLPGSRPDGGMSPIPSDSRELLKQVAEIENTLRANLVDARNIIDNFERDYVKLEAELASERALHEECKAKCEELKSVLRKAAEIMVNGNKKTDQ